MNSFVTSASNAAGVWGFEVEVNDSASSVVTVTSGVVSVVVDSALVAPSVSASVGVVDQGQTIGLSSSVVSSGTSPYIYQWLSRSALLLTWLLLARHHQTTTL